VRSGGTDPVHPSLTPLQKRVQIRCVGISVLGPLTLDGSVPRLIPWRHSSSPPSQWRAMSRSALISSARSSGGTRLRRPGTRTCRPVSCSLRKVSAPRPSTTGHGYRLALPVDALDARRFEALVTRGHALLELGETDRAAYVLGRRSPCGADARTPSSRSGSPATSRRRACPSYAWTPRNGGLKPQYGLAAIVRSSPRPKPCPNAAPSRERLSANETAAWSTSRLRFRWGSSRGGRDTVKTAKGSRGAEPHE
jgi:hypothetical protein